MNTLYTLRHTYKLTLDELAHMTGITTGKLARAEQGLCSLSNRERARVANVFGVPEETFRDVQTMHPKKCNLTAFLLDAFHRRTMLLFLIIGMGIVVIMHPHVLPTTSATALFAESQRTPNLLQEAYVQQNVSTESLVQRHDTPSHEEWMFIPTVAPYLLTTETPTPTPTSTPIPEPTPIPTPHVFVASTGGPYGCPLQPSVGRVVMTQAYGVGSHVPADVWGAVDLGVDTSGDRYADTSATDGTLIVATHRGVAHVALNYGRGGNQVTLVNNAQGWRTNYAHMSEVLVTNGQYVAPGQGIGLVGSTGDSTGPHLDYQVWVNGVNVDPTEMVAACW